MKACLLAALVVVAPACGNGNGGGKFAEVYCAEAAKCCTQLGISGNGQLCRFMLSAAPANAATDACLAEMHAQVAAGTFCSHDGPSEACNAAFSSSATGNKKPGETCDTDSECAPSSDGKVLCASRFIDDVWIHKCQVQMRGQAGDGPCLGTQDGAVFSSLTTSPVTDVASRGYVCDTADGVECASDKCVALASLGQSCAYSNDCVRTAFCDSKDRCVARVAAGATCTGADSDECAIGYYCPDASPRQCNAQVGTGASCSSEAMCKSNTCVDGTCKPNMLETFGWALICG
jgi:hypothetical protein